MRERTKKFNNIPYYLTWENLPKPKAEHYKAELKKRGYMVRVVRSTAYGHKNQYNVWRG